MPAPTTQSQPFAFTQEAVKHENEILQRVLLANLSDATEEKGWLEGARGQRDVRRIYISDNILNGRQDPSRVTTLPYRIYHLVHDNANHHCASCGSPTPSPVESPSLTTISSLTTTIPITPSAPVRRNGSVRSMWTMESDRTYDSADLRPSPPYIPVDLPPEAEYEPSYSGLEGTMSVISYASPGYDVVRHHVSPPSAASMDSRLIDYSSPEAMSRGSDRRPSLTPSRIEESLSSETTITLPPLPPSPERTPSLHTTQPSSISFTTPEGNKPSIESEETVYSDHDLGEGGIPPSHIISHDVNRLLQYLHDIDTAREGETRDMSDHLRRIEEELFDLSAFLRTRRPTPPPAQPQYVPHPVEVPAPAPAPTPVVVPMPVPIPVPVEVPVRQPPPIPPRPVAEHDFEEYVPMSDASTDVSLSEREEVPTPIAAPVPPQPVSEVSSIDLSESIESMSERASTVPSVTLSDESSISRSMLSSSIITMSPSVSISAISADLLRTPSQSVREPAASPVSLQIPVSPSISSAATPELSPPSSRSSSSAELAGLTPSPSVQPEVLPDVTIKSSSPLLSKSPSISAATERSVTPIPEHVPAKRVQSLSPPPVRRPSPVLSESDYFISSPLLQDTFRDLPRAYSTSPSMSVVSIESQGTAKPDSKGSMGIEELRALLKDLLKQQDVVAGRQDDHTALLEELRNRPPPAVVYQAPEISELSEHRVALTKIENILGDLVDRFDIVQDSISSSSLTRSSTLTSSSETISSSTTSRPTYRSSEDERLLRDKWNQVTQRPAISIPPRRRSPLPSLDGGLPPSQVSESEVDVPPPTATTALPLIPTLRPRPRRRRARSASPTLTFERLIGSVASSVTSSEEIEEMFGIPPFRGDEKVVRTPAAPVAPPTPVLEEPRTPSVAEQPGDIDIDFERKLREIRKQRAQGGDGTYIPSMPQPPAEPVLPPTFYPEREDDATPRPLSPPSDLGQAGRRCSPVSESWYTRPRPPPTAEEATEVEWRPEPGTTIVPPSHVIGSQPPLRPHPDQIIPIEQVLGDMRPVQPQPTGATEVSGLPDYNELLGVHEEEHSLDPLDPLAGSSPPAPSPAGFRPAYPPQPNQFCSCSYSQ
ncbi:hypothetical protein FS749_009959 [Ceratobasidium sp. UAMH 11750]|nr:hypothetical protein FS749_009959 [Ceratobasidium sp. UAMH 11750]